MTLLRRRALVLVAVLAASAPGHGRAASPKPDASHGIVFSPQGSVKRVRQVTARFPRPMVALGDPRAPLEPFAIACPAKATARWIDTRTWSYDFESDLPAGLRCRFTLAPGAQALDGTPLPSGRARTRAESGGSATMGAVHGPGRDWSVSQ